MLPISPPPLPTQLPTKNYQHVSYDTHQQPILIIDNGSFTSRVGYSNEDAPRSVFPTVFGKVGGRSIMRGLNIREGYAGNEAISKRGIARLRFPIEKGIVHSWENMEYLWSHTLILDMGISMDKHCVLLTETALNPKENREKMCQTMFEKFEVPAMYIAVQSVLSLFGSGRSSGIVLDCGYEISQTVPVYEGHALPHAISRLELGGKDITDGFWPLIRNFDIDINNYYLEREILTKIKETLCFVALVYETELKKEFESSTPDSLYELPDGKFIHVGMNERIGHPEQLFQPIMTEMEEMGVHEMIHNSIRKCDLEIRKDLYSNIVLAGGSTLFKGFPERIRKELTELAPSMDVDIIAPPDRDHSSWKGGRILSSMPTFPSMCITSAEYYETGSGIVHRKCF